MPSYDDERKTSALLPLTRRKSRRHKSAFWRYSDYFWLFFFGSVVGFFLEGIWSVVLHGSWESHAATVWGPFCIVYGAGTALMYRIARWMSGCALWLQFVSYAVGGSALEYAAGLFQEKCFGSCSWDYSDQFMNLDGRISLRMTLVWGVLGVLFSCFFLPPILRWLPRTHTQGFRVACLVLSFVMAADLAMTSAAVWRWRERMEATPAVGGWQRFLDTHYDDDTMRTLFPNMTFR